MTKQKQIKVGLPNAMLYHRYEVLWKRFFEGLGIDVVVSEPTSRRVLEDGMELAADEACLPLKIFFGHIRSLSGACDYILVPRISNFGRQRAMCVRFAGLYDLTRTIFRETDQKFLTYNVDVIGGCNEKSAFLEMGESLGYSAKVVRRAYDEAKKADVHSRKEAIQRQQREMQTDGIKILIAAHSYVLKDPYIGRPITDYLKTLGVTPLRSDLAEPEMALKRSLSVSPTCKWEISRELIGGLAMYRDRADGVILLSAFPCSLDAVVNELLLRKLKGIPVLNLVLDGQSGTAGVETRLESFVDIIRFQKGEL